MNDNPSQPEQMSLARLRLQAKLSFEGFAQPFKDNPAGASPDDMQRLWRELHLHQLELELQNEQLRSTQLALELERSRYVDLYDLAPVAYCTLSDKGLILQANLTGAALLGIPRQALCKRPFSGFIHRDHQDTYDQHCQQLTRTSERQTCELQLVKASGEVFWGNLVSTVQQEPDGLAQQRLVISDISAHKRTSLAERQAELACSLLQSQEQSRQRFARELHDRTSANLAALRLNLELILKTAAPRHITRYLPTVWLTPGLC